jgi:uncharacterized membrane protein YphA (DoxX/SURF4 family)
MLVLLRMSVGWHILYEGLWKHEQQDFSADGYLSMASGPFADYFRYEVMEDFEGRKHLDLQWNVDRMTKYRDAFVAQAKLDDADKAKADQILETRKKNVENFLAEKTNATLFANHFAAWDELKADKEKLKKGGTSFEAQRVWDAQQDLRKEARAWIGWIDDQHDALHSDLAGLLPSARRAERVKPSITEIIADKSLFVTYSSIAIGACMIGGLFTRLASLGGGIFLLMIVAAKWQWPGHYAPPAHPSQGHSLYVTKEFIEMMVCFAMATLPTGRWAGLDYFLHGLIVRPFMRNKD